MGLAGGMDMEPVLKFENVTKHYDNGVHALPECFL